MGEASLLFVAHRKEILEQSLAVFRAAVQDGSFGELLVGPHKPIHGRHVFASIQSLHKDRLAELDPSSYDVLIVDEFHHAEAPTYQQLLNHLRPKFLLGLTATPERTDGQSILGGFDDRVASEMRLWDAIDQDLLVPFQYFGVHDGTDLSVINWRSGRYDVASLEKIYTADDYRASLVLRAIHERIRAPHKMRALGFCVSIAHAKFMAAYCCQHGLDSLAVTSETSPSERKEALRMLSHGESQSATRADSPTGQRYQGKSPLGWRTLLFVREAKRDARGVTMPYLFLGPVKYLHHKGEKPMQITWALERAMPQEFFRQVKVAAG